MCIEAGTDLRLRRQCTKLTPPTKCEPKPQIGRTERVNLVHHYCNSRPQFDSALPLDLCDSLS